MINTTYKLPKFSLTCPFKPTFFQKINKGPWLSITSPDFIRNHHFLPDFPWLYEPCLKTMKILSFFVNFRLNQIRNCSVQINKMKDGIFSFQITILLLPKLTDDARHENVASPLDLTRILKSYHKRNDRRKFPEKYEELISREINHEAWLVKNDKTLFSKLMQKIS